MIDDSAANAKRILDQIRRSGFAPAHKRVATPRALKFAIARESWDIIVADLGKSGVTTLIALAKLKKSNPDLPCVLLCRKTDENDALKAIIAGMPGCRTCRVPARLGAAVRAELRAAERRSKHRRAEDRLHRDERLHRQAFETMLEGCALHELILDAHGRPSDYRFLAVNPAFERITGLTAAQVIGKTVREVIPEIEPFWIETYGRVTLTGEPARFEHFSQPLGKHFEAFATRSARMEFAVVFRDISESRRTEIMLKSLVEQNLAGIYLIQDGRFVYANARLAAMHGYTPQEILALPSVENLIAEPDRAKVLEGITKRITGEIDAQQHSFHVRRKDGSTFEVEVHGVRIEHQNRPAILGTAIDITERRRAESALRESQRRQRALLYSIDDGAWLKDREGRYLEVNRNVGRSVGANAADLIGKTDVDIYPATLAEEIRSEDRQVIETGNPLRIEHSVVRDGATRWLEVVKVPVFDDQGTAIGTAGISRDITERKRAQTSLQRAEAYFRSLIENSAEMIAVLGADQSFVYQSPAAERITGYKPEEFAGRKFAEFIHPDDLSALAAGFARNAQQTGQIGPVVEFRHRRKDGSWCYLAAIGHTVEREDGSRVMVSNARDITEHKRAEQALRESEERYRAMFEAQRDAMVLADAETHRFIEVNQAFVALYGYTRDELLRMKGPDISAEPRAEETFVKEVIEAAPGRAILHRHRRKDGSELRVEISAVTTTLCGRKMYCAIIRDVSERERAESELQRFRLAMDASIDSIYLTDPAAMRFVDVNAAACRRLGYAREQLLAMQPHDLTGVDRERLSRDFDDVMASGEQGISSEQTYIRSDGSRGWTELHRRALRSEGQWLIVTLGRDITDRRLAEQALRENEEKYRLIFEGESDAIGLLDGDTHQFLDVNQAFVALYGYGKSELLGMKAQDLSMDPRATEAHLTTISEGEITRIPLRMHRKKDGTSFPVEIANTPIMLQGKRAISAIMVSPRPSTNRSLAKPGA